MFKTATKGTETITQYHCPDCKRAWESTDKTWFIEIEPPKNIEE